jgi:hypothetical protein
MKKTSAEPFKTKRTKEEQKHPQLLEAIPEPVHPTKTMRAMTWVVVGMLIAIAFGLFIILRWSFQDIDVLEIHNNPFPARIVNDTTGQTGGIVFLRADYCKNANITGDLRMSYVSSSREVFLPPTKEQLPKGCDSREVPVVIPKELPKDTYRIKFRATYDVNPLKTGEVVNFESQPFTVGSNSQ